QRILERKWRLNEADRERWGKLRRVEALAALRLLGVNASAACFLGLPDQKLTSLLIRDAESALERFAAIIADWAPTHLLVPSISDKHPDHNALAVMLRLIWNDFFSDQTAVSVSSYLVHGNSRAFFEHAQPFRQSEIETATKLRAIRCHRSQLTLSRRRFLAYAARSERLLKLRSSEQVVTDGSIFSVSRQMCRL